MGILKTAATVAVASSVHGRIQRRQQNRWAAQDAAAAQPAPHRRLPHRHRRWPRNRRPAAPLAPPADITQRLAQLAQLGDLKSAGIFTEAEFEQQKARILNA